MFRSSNSHFVGGSPKCALCAAYAVASSSIESSVAVKGSSFTTPENTARSPISVSMTNLGRTRALEQLFFVNLAGASSNLGGNFPIAHLFPFAQRGVRQRKANAIIDKTKVPGGFGHAIRCEPFRETGIVPIGVEHERRTHHHSAAPIEPLLLLARSWQTNGIH